MMPRLTTRLAAPIVAVILTACGGGSTVAGPTERPAAGGTCTLASPVAVEGGTLPADDTRNGMGSTIALSRSNAPARAREVTLMMTTLLGDGTTKWNWVLYGIPGTTGGLAPRGAGVGTLGVGSDGPAAAYQPRCSQGSGAKIHTVTIYALSASSRLSVPVNEVTGPLFTSAIAFITLDSASLNLSDTRPQ
jgi:hypothetical protein